MRGLVNEPGEAETVQGDEDSGLSLGHTERGRALWCSWTWVQWVLGLELGESSGRWEKW